jgi:membrane protease YdiL (CAAX protease family)
LLAGFWFVKTKNLGNAIVLHATTNLCLGIYVIATKSWFFW